MRIIVYCESYRLARSMAQNCAHLDPVAQVARDGGAMTALAGLAKTRDGTKLYIRTV